jgi:uncharacterized protein with PQ loop repeat
MYYIIQLAGMAAAVTGIITFIPQVIKCWRNRHTPDQLAGLSSATLWLLFTCQTCWAIYGFGVGAIWTALPAIFVGPMALYMIYVISSKESQQL